jgi:hypothetical protein
MNTCYIGCKHLRFRDGPNLCSNAAAIREHGSVLAHYYGCLHCEEKPSLREELQSQPRWKYLVLGLLMSFYTALAILLSWSLTLCL